MSESAQVEDGAADPRERDRAEEKAIKQSTKTAAEAKEKQSKGAKAKGTAMM